MNTFNFCGFFCTKSKVTLRHLNQINVSELKINTRVKIITYTFAKIKKKKEQGVVERAVRNPQKRSRCWCVPGLVSIAQTETLACVYKSVLLSVSLALRSPYSHLMTLAFRSITETP